MPAARQRPLEDSRSETSSTIATLKDRSALVHTTTMLTTTVKSRKPHAVPAISLGAVSKILVNGGGMAATAALLPEVDPNLPKVRLRLTAPPTYVHSGYRHSAARGAHWYYADTSSFDEI